MLTIQELLARLPQTGRILVDRVTELTDTKAVGYKNVTMDEPHFRGHFPGKPVMPGVLTVEALMQLASLIYIGNPTARYQAKKIDLKRVDRLKFRRQVVPGDRLELEVNVVSCDGSLATVNAVATVEGEVASSGVLSFSLIK